MVFPKRIMERRTPPSAEGARTKFPRRPALQNTKVTWSYDQIRLRMDEDYRRILLSSARESMDYLIAML